MMENTLLQRLMRQAESPPTWLLLCLAFAWVLARYWPIWDAGRIGDVLGWALIAAAVVLMVWSVREFRRHRTTIIPREVPSAMIDTGPYQHSRNPIYLADAAFLTGMVLIWDAGGLVLVPMFMAVITRRFILGEEAGMRAMFGAAFDDYAARVRRWV
jgi:protein-S-isoprenylcysteine O-methyltransferase Ste14